MNTDIDAITRLADYWSAQGLAFNGGATADMVKSFESTHGVILPKDFAEYILRLNGLAEFGPGADENGFGFAALQRLRPVAPSEYPLGSSGPGHFVFADYLHWSWGYALQLADERTRGEVIHVATLEPKVVAPSFGAFIELYLVDSPQLYPERRKD